MGDIITKHDFNPKAQEIKEVTQARATNNLKTWCMVIGYDEEGVLWHNTGIASAAEQILVLEQIKKNILDNL